MDNIFNVTDYLNVGLDDVHKLVCLPTKKVLNFNNVVNSRGYNDSVIICTKDGIKSVFSRPDGRVVASLNSDKYYCSDSFYFTFEVDTFRLFNMRKNSFSNYTFNNVKGLTQNDFSAVWSDNRNTAIVARGQCYGLFDFKKNTYIADTIYLDVYSYSGHYYIGEYRTDEIVQTSEIDSKGVKYIKRIKKSKTEYDIINKSGKILLQGLRRKTEFVNRDLLLYYHESPDSIFILNAISGKSTFFTKRTNWYSSPNLIGDHFVYFDDKFYSINDLMNRNVSPILVDNITELKSTGCYIYRYEKGNRFGFYQGYTKATEPIYDVVYNYVEEYIGVKQDGKIGLFKFKCSQPLLFPKQ
jgi:hypothetical protein